MSNLIGIGLIVLILCIYYSRSISKEALEHLSEKQKSDLTKQFARTGNLYLLPMLIGFAAYIGIVYITPEASDGAFVTLILFFLFFLFYTSAKIIRKMQESGLPEAYIKEYRQSRWIYNGGFALCGGILLYELLK